MSTSWTHISGFVANYEDGQRHRLDYPSYSLASFSASYSKRIGKVTHGVGLAVRNALDTDLLQSVARLGAGRDVSISYRLMW